MQSGFQRRFVRAAGIPHRGGQPLVPPRQTTALGSLLHGIVGDKIQRKNVDEDALMEIGMEAGMEDMVTEEDSFEIYTTTEDFNAVSDALIAAGYELAEAEIEYLPSMESNPDEATAKSLKKLITELEENDDVQKVTTNCGLDLDD